VRLVERCNARWLDDVANAVCLCANHFAQWRHAAKAGPPDIIQTVLSLNPETSPDELRIPITLAGERHVIRYDPKHILALQELIRVSQRAQDSACPEDIQKKAKPQHGSVSVERLEEQILGARFNKEGGDGGLSVKITLCEQPEDITFSERHILAQQELLKRSISEITSNEPPSVPIAPQSEPKITQSKTVKSPEMTTCPECGDKIKKTRLERHLQKVHRKRLGKKPATGPTRILRNGKWELNS
jgi:hypothetical protein